MTRLESKIKQRPVIRQFKKEFDMMNININEVEMTDDYISKLSDCCIENMFGNWMGDFYMSGECGIDGDYRMLHINIPYAGYEGLLPAIVEVLSELENNEYDEVEEFASEVRFRLASEARKQADEEAAKLEVETEETTETPTFTTAEAAATVETEETTEETTETPVFTGFSTAN